jgi:hypothetical protein
MLSNKKIINEIRQNQQDYVNTRPEMMFKPFVSNRAERDYNLGDRIGGYKSLGQHPRYSASINNNTAFPDPLFGGSVSGDMYNNYLDFNKRYDGGAVLSEKMPLTGGYCSSSDSDSDFYSDSDSESESESESDSDSDEYETDSDSEYSDSDSEYEGGGLYDDYVKPAGKALYNVGHEVLKDVVFPVGREILKDAIIGLMSGGRMRGGKITGTKDEFIHILRKINPELTKKELSKNTKNKLARKLYQILEIGMHPDDLETLHYLDALTKNYGQRGGLNGNKKELIAIIKAMYPNIDLKKMSKKEIINEIKKEQPAREIKVKKEKVVKAPKEAKKRGRPVKIKEPKEPKEPKKRGRPVKEKVAKEPKKRGRPVKIKEPKEPKKRGRKPKQTINIIEDVLPVVEKVKKPRKTKSKIDKLLKTDEDDYKEIEKMFKQSNKLDKQDKKLDTENKKLDKYIEKINKEPKKRGRKPKTVVKEPVKKNIKVKIKKIVGTKKGEKVRGDIVAEVMKKQGLTLPEASKYVKDNNLY